MSNAASSTAIATVEESDESRIARRRDFVARRHFIERIPVAQVIAELGKLEPSVGPFSRPTVYRDLQLVRKDFRKYVASMSYDPEQLIAETFVSLDHVAGRALARAENEEDTGKAATMYRVYLEAIRDKTTLAQHVGLVDRRLGTLFVKSDPNKEAKALPQGTELIRQWRNVNVNEDAELVSDAERAWKHGDQATAEAAAAADGNTIDGEATPAD